MVILLIILFILIILIILVFVIRVTIFIEYRFNGSQDNTVINFSILKGLIKYKFHPKETKNKEKQEEDKKEAKKGKEGLADKIGNFYRIYKTYINIQFYLKDRLKLKKLYINLDFGTGDAYYTGILTGYLWMLAGTLTSYLFNTYEKCENKVVINPKFSEKAINGHFYSIFTIKIVHIIVVITKIKFKKLNNKKHIKGGGISA